MRVRSDGKMGELGELVLGGMALGGLGLRDLGVGGEGGVKERREERCGCCGW